MNTAEPTAPLQAADAGHMLALMAMEELKKERELRIELEQQLEAQRGKVLFADAVSSGRKSILVGEMANILKQSGIEIGQIRLFDWLRTNGYLYRQPCGDNRPTQKSLEMGIIEIAECVVMHPSGRSSVNRTVKITPNGQMYFMDVLNRHRDEINQAEQSKKKEQNQRKVERQRMKRLQAKQNSM